MERHYTYHAGYFMNVLSPFHNEGSGMFKKRGAIVIFEFFYTYTDRTWEFLQRTPALI